MDGCVNISYMLDEFMTKIDKFKKVGGVFKIVCDESNISAIFAHNDLALHITNRVDYMKMCRAEDNPFNSDFTGKNYENIRIVILKYFDKNHVHDNELEFYRVYYSLLNSKFILGENYSCLDISNYYTSYSEDDYIRNTEKIAKVGKLDFEGKLKYTEFTLLINYLDSLHEFCSADNIRKDAKIMTCITGEEVLGSSMYKTVKQSNKIMGIIPYHKVVEELDLDKLNNATILLYKEFVEFCESLDFVATDIQAIYSLKLNGYDVKF